MLILTYVRPAFFYTKALVYNSVAKLIMIRQMSDHDQTFKFYCLGSLNLLCDVSSFDALNF